MSSDDEESRNHGEENRASGTGDDRASRRRPVVRRNRPEDLRTLLLARSAKTSSGCLEWTAGLGRGGYGKLKVSGVTLSAHRAAYLAFVGEIPNGLNVCHRCDNPLCLNPDHLFLGTTRENMADKVSKLRQARGDRQGLRLHPERAPRGERNGAARLTVDHVLAIRASHASRSKLATDYLVSKSTIDHIITRKTWRHV